MESCYIPNNPQFELSLEYGSYNGGAFNAGFAGCDTGQDTGVICFSDNCDTCGQSIGQDCAVAYARECEEFRGSECHQCTNCELNCDENELTDINHCADEELHVNLGIEAGDCERNAQNQSHKDADDGEQLVNGQPGLSAAVGGGGGSYWSAEDMASFTLPNLDLDPLPSLFPFSPCAANYKSASECRDKQLQGPVGENVADVLLSLKHAVVHAGESCTPPHHLHHQQHEMQQTHQLSVHPTQVMMGGVGGNSGPYGGSPAYYEQYGGTAPLFPTMSVNVSMNMTMHGYPPEQMCPQMQWNQNAAVPSVNVVYPQNQNILSPQTYSGGATYSFTADFRTPNQSDPLITAASSFKPLQFTNNQKPTVQNYNLFGQKPAQASFPPVPSNMNQKHASINHGMSPVRTRSSSKLQGHEGPVFAPSPYMSGNSVSSGGKVQIGALSGCSGGSGDDEQKPNLCRICGKTYARPSTLKTHLRTHSGERPYRCADCNKSFSQAANLTAHVRTHTGQKPFRCPICDRRFSQSSSVTTHMRTHSGERPYRCRSCKKAFSDSSTLTKHLRIHSGEKPYQCKLCLLRFSQSGNLNRHMRVHGNSALLG